ncbi:MAG TPA: DUF4347 domain-containing protein [Bradyrhizobium sp.]
MFIDSRVPDIDDLLNGLKPGEKAFVIDGASDGLDQIAGILKAEHLSSLDGIQIVSHGASGALELGATILNDADLSGHASALASIGAVLASGGNLSLYACDVAQGAAGQQFIADLSQFAGGADVFAATHEIGLTAAGENWTLDATTGAHGISAAFVQPFTASAEAGFSGTLSAAPDPQIWLVSTFGGDANELTKADDNGSGVASNFVKFFDPVTHNPSDTTTPTIQHLDLVAFDTARDLVFFSSSDAAHPAGSGHEYIYSASISQIANGNGGITPTLTPIYQSTASDVISTIAVDPASQQVFFTEHQSLFRVSESGGAAVTLGTLPNGAFADSMALDLPNHVAYFTSSRTNSTSHNGVHSTTVFSNAIYKATNVTTNGGTNSVTITKLADVNPHTVGLVGFEDIQDIAVDTATGKIYFTSIGDAITNGGGVFEMDPDGTIHTIWTQASNPLGAGPSGPNGLIGAITVDSQTGKYYISVGDSNPGDNSGNHAIYVGNLSDTNNHAPTLFEQLAPYPTGVGNNTQQTQPQGMAIDNAPVLSLTSASPAYTETAGSPSADATPVTLISGSTLTDSDNTLLASGSVSITSGFDNGVDKLSINGSATGTVSGTSISFSYNAGTGVMAFTGVDTVANYQAALAAVKFVASGDNPTNYGTDTSRTLTYKVSDGLLDNTADGSIAAPTVTVAVTATDDAPVNHTGSVSATGNEDATFSITGLTVTDVDADPASQNIQVTLSVAHGTLSLNAGVAGGITGGEISGNASNSVTITATQNQINATFGNATGLQYHGDANFNTGFAAENLHIDTSDLGHTGTGGPLTDTDDVAVTVNAVNDNPNLQPDTTPPVSYTENASATAIFSGENVDSPIADVDQPANYAGGSIDLNITAGAVTGDRISLTGSTFHISGGNIQDSGNVTIGTITGNGTNHVTISALTSAATPSVVDAVLKSFGYDSTSDDPGSGARTITLTFNDGGNTGIGGGLTDAVTQTVNVTPVNDPPTVSATGTNPTFTENGAGVDLFSGVSVSAVEAADKIDQVVLVVSGVADGANEVLSIDGTNVALNNGNSTTTATNGVGVSVAVSGSTATVTLSKAGGVTSSTMTGVIDGLTYADNGDTPTAGIRAVALTSIHDTGGTANGGLDTTGLSIASTVAVQAVNDAPVVTAGGTLAYTENDGPKVIAAGASVTDVDSADFNTGSLTVAVSGSHVEDQLLILQDATVDVEAGGIVSVNGNVIGTIDVTHNGVNGASLEIDFNSANATPGAVTTLMDHIEYRDSSDDPSTAARTVTFTVNDGDGGTATGSATSILNVTAVNDAPVATITPTGYSGQPNVAIDLKNNGLSVADIDGENGSETVTLSVTSGALTVTAGGSGAGVSGSGTNSVTITGTIAQINALLDTDATSTVSFIDPTGGVKTLTLAVHDNGNTGGGDLSAQDTAQLVLDQPPVVDLNGATAGTGVTLAITENDPATAIAPAGLTTDSDSTDFNGGSLTVHVAAGVAQDQLSILTDATVTVAAGVVSVGGLTVGMVTGGANGTDLVVSLNTADATPAAISTLIEHIQYANSSDDPAASRSITFTVDDGDGSTGSAVATVNITAVNDEPTLTATAVNPTFTEGGSLADLFTTPIVASTIEAGQTFSSLTMTVTNVTDGPNELLRINGVDIALTNGSANVGVGTVNVSLSSGTATLTLSGATLTASQLQTLIDGLSYHDDGDDPTGGNRVVTITEVIDSGSGTPPNDNAATLGVASTVTVVPVNDPPSLSGIAATAGYTENAAGVTLSPSAVIGDPDPVPHGAPGGNGLILDATVKITDFQPGDELLVLDTTTGIASTSGFYTGINVQWNYDSATGILTLTSADQPPTGDTIIDYDHVLQHIQFASTSDDPTNGGAHTTRSITWQVQDAGGTANGGQDLSTIGPNQTTTLSITASNDTPVAAITPPSYSATEGLPLDLKNNGLSVSDVDGNLGLETVTLSVSEGVLNVTAGGTPVVVANSGTNVVTLTGSAADINALLNTDASSTVAYVDNNDVPAASAVLTLTINDNGNTGGGDLSSTAVTTINITAVDDAPVLTGFGDTPAYIENGAPVRLDVNSNATVSDPELDVSANHYQGASLTLLRDGGANPDDLFAGTGSLDLVDVNGNGENVSLDGGATFIGTFFNPADGSVTFNFNANATAADIDSVMRQIVYSNASDNPPASVPIDFIFNDGNGQPGGQDQGTGTGVSTATINVQVAQADDAPTLLNVAPTQGYVVGSSGVTLSPALVVFDPDATPPSPLTGIANTRVAITGGFQPTDQLFVKLPTSGGFFIVDDGSGPVVTNIAVAGNAGGVLTLSGTDTTQHYQLVLDAVNYSSSAADPTAGGTDPGRTIDWQVNDGLLSSPTPGPDVNETLLNFVTAPQVDLDASGAGTGFATTFTENGAPLAIVDTDVSVTAPSIANLESATIVLTDAKAGDSLSIAGTLPGGIDATIDTSVAGKITMHLSNSASVADYQTALGQIRFVNSSDNPDTTDRDITVQVTGDETDSNVAHATVHVVAVNDPPVNTVPGSFVGVITQPTAFNGLSVSDPDAISLTTQLHVDHGVLNVGTSGGGATVSGSGTATVTLTGSVAQIDATLHAANNVVYQTNFTFAGTDHLTMTSNDGGGSGTGGPMTDTDTVVINVTTPASGGAPPPISVVGSPGVTSPAASFAGDSFAFSHVDLHGFHLI